MFSCFVPVLFSIVITSLWEEKAGLYASRVSVCLSCMHLLFVFFSSSWCRGLAADCDCDCCTPWTFHLNFAVHKILEATDLTFDPTVTKDQKMLNNTTISMYG